MLSNWQTHFLAPHGLSPTDPGWIGAWWLGFLIVSAGLFFPSLILFCFPQIDFSLRKKKKNAGIAQNDKESQKIKKTLLNNDGKEKTTEPKLLDGNENVVEKVNKKPLSTMKIMKIELKQFSTSLCECLRSPIYLGCLMGRLFDAFAFKGFFVFQPKYLEHHYGVPQYKTNFYMALMGIIGFAMGVLVGSIIMRKCKLEGRKAAAFIGVASLLSSLLAFSLISLSCDSVNNQINLDGRLRNYSYTKPCNKHCHCKSQSLFPVCDLSGKAYFSPCHAGCRQVRIDSEETLNFNISDCSCAPNSGPVSKDFCSNDCSQMFIYYILISVISGIISGSQVIPGILMLFRSVSNKVRSVALGFLGFMVSLFSTFPSPIIFGLIIDTTCMLWETTCGTKGACLLYDSTLIRVRIHVFQAVLRAVALLFDVWNWYHAKDMKLMQEDLEVVAEENDDEPSEESDKNNKEAPLLEGGEQQTAMMTSLSPPQIEQRRKSHRNLSGAVDARKRSSLLNMIEKFGSLYELEMKAQGPESSPSPTSARKSIT